MTWTAFSSLLTAADRPVVLLEGVRDLPYGVAPRLTALAAHLASIFLHVRFRTGNAPGSDEAFAAGVASVDATRLELVLPYGSHRRASRPADSASLALDDIPSHRLQEVMDATVEASPKYERLAVDYRDFIRDPRKRATAQLLLRDTLKVTGTDTLTPPVAGIFFVNAAEPGRGGTGHTMRVCRSHGVPVITQDHWRHWPFP
jgi:hypothetical protein